LLLLLLFLKNEREREKRLFCLAFSSRTTLFSLAQHFIVFRCTSFIEREHQPSLKAIKKVRKKKSHHELAPPEPPGLATTIL
jgi:hypothetical protein